MSVTPKTILGSDTLSGSRITLNENFTTLSDAINAIGTIVNTDEQSIQTIKSLTLVDGTIDTPNPNSTNLSTNASGNIGGNLTVGYDISASSLSLNNAGSTALSINTGDLDILSANSMINNSGGMKNAGSFIMSGITNIFRANLLSNFTGGEGGTNYYDSIGATYVGQITAANNSVMLIDMSSYNNSVSAESVRHFKLLTDGIANGHTLKLIFVLDSLTDGNSITDDGGLLILNDNISIPNIASGTDKTIKINASYQAVDFVFYNNTWIYLNDYSTSDSNNPLITSNYPTA